MSSTKIETNLDFRGNEAQNMVKHKLASAPSIPKEGQEYYNTSTHKAAYWNGYEWVEDILIATDEEVLAGTDETKAINPKQLKTVLEDKQSVLGYVPENSENKVISLTENSTNIQYPSAKAVYDELQLKATLQSPAFTGTVTVPTVSEGDNSSKAANTAFVTTAINNAVQGGMIYVGAWDTTNATDYSALNSYRPIKKGSVFRCNGTGCTIDGVNYNEGDTIIFNRDVASDTKIITAAVDHYDHTLSEDVVLKEATQTLKNKTISSSDNTISGLNVANFAQDVIKTSISTAVSDNALLTEKAISDELNLKAPLANPNFTGIVTVPTVADGDNSVKAANTAFVTTAINNALKSGLSKEIYTNSLLEPVDGVCTWSINHTLSTSDILCTIKEVATGNEVLMSKQSVSSTEYRITFNAAASVGANTYKAILIGV